MLQVLYDRSGPQKPPSSSRKKPSSVLLQSLHDPVKKLTAATRPAAEIMAYAVWVSEGRTDNDYGQCRSLLQAGYP